VKQNGQNVSDYRQAGTAVLLALVAARALAKPVQERHRFCVRAADGTWSLQTYQPLISLTTRMTFEQVTYDGTTLRLVRVRSFDPSYELRFEYKFDAEGKMLSTHGFLKRWGRWAAGADLFPDADGKVSRPAVNYFLREGGNQIVEPDDGPEYTALFRNVPVYRTSQDIPCAGLLQEAEKMNATQK
jgi:hypothetical protein